MAQKQDDKKTGLYDKTSPFTSALYFEQNLHFRQVMVRRETLRAGEGAHQHDEIEMLYFHAGSGVLRVNGVAHPVGPGALAWLFPFHVHALAPEGGPLQFTSLRYSLGTLMYLNIDRRFLQSVMVLEQAAPCIPLAGAQRAAAAAICEEMERETALKGHSYELVLFSGILRLVTYFERSALTQVQLGIPAARNAAWTALQYIHFHFNQGIDAAKTAGVLGLTAPQLNRMLRLLTGMNFRENLALVRVRNACAMMQYEELTLPYIASYVGYSSLAAFYRNFKAVKNTTPDQYRKSLAAAAPPPARLPSDTARALLIYISDHYREPLNAKTAAKALYISESALTAAVERGFGVSFAKLVASVRLWVGAGLLQATGLGVGDVALAVGFGSERSFCRNFREMYGCAPGAYRHAAAPVISL